MYRFSVWVTCCFLICCFSVAKLSAQRDGFEIPRALRMKGNASENGDSAIAYFREALQWYEKRKVLPHEEAAACLNNLGREYVIKGLVDSGLMFYRQCIQMYLDCPPTHFSQRNICISLNNMAIGFKEGNKMDSARKYYEMSMDKAFSYRKIEEDKLSDLVKNTSDFYSEIGDEDALITLRNRFFVGRKIPEFQFMERTGSMGTSARYQGKWLLLDFWASWCGPCLREMKVLKHIDTTFEDMEILGISIDEDYEDWMHRIVDMELNWNHGVETADVKNKATSWFHVTTIPRTVLIDPTGIIRAYGLRGENLIVEIKRQLQH